MVDGYGKQVKRVLQQHGYELYRRGKGDHEVWWHPDTSTKVTVDNTKSRHLANEILKDAGIKHRF